MSPKYDTGVHVIFMLDGKLYAAWSGESKAGASGLPETQTEKVLISEKLLEA